MSLSIYEGNALGNTESQWADLPKLALAAPLTCAKAKARLYMQRLLPNQKPPPQCLAKKRFETVLNLIRVLKFKYVTHYIDIKYVLIYISYHSSLFFIIYIFIN